MRHGTSFSDSFAGTTSYTYDNYNQLLAGAGPGSATSSVAADSAGNISSLGTATPGVGRYARTSTTLASFSYDSANKMTQEALQAFGLVQSASVEPIVCDGTVGSLDTIGPAPSGGRAYLYDRSNRLSESHDYGTSDDSFFLYDGLGRLSEVYDNISWAAPVTTVADHSYAWCGQKICMEFNNLEPQAFIGPSEWTLLGATVSGTPDATYVAQGTITDLYATTSYDIKDLLGSERAVVNANATPAIIAQYEYDNFGNRTTVAGSSTASNFGFTGFYYHTASGLQFARNRVYNSSLGRWMTRDPIGIDHAFEDPARFNATDLNLYAYAGNNPQSMVDPSGYCGYGFRLPDYLAGQFQLPLFGLGSTWNVQVTFDRYGRSYLGIGLGAASPGAFGITGVGGWLDSPRGVAPTAAELQNFITGDSLNFSANANSPTMLGLAGGAVSSGEHWGYEAGVSAGPPGVGVSGTFQHTWNISGSQPGPTW